MRLLRLASMILGGFIFAVLPHFLLWHYASTLSVPTHEGAVCGIAYIGGFICSEILSYKETDND